MNELEQANAAGFGKLPEQMEAIEQEAFERGYSEATQDAAHGRMWNDGILNRQQVLDFLEMYKMAVHQSIQDISGVYRLGNGGDDHERLSHLILTEADEKFGDIIPGNKSTE